MIGYFCSYKIKHTDRGSPSLNRDEESQNVRNISKPTYLNPVSNISQKRISEVLAIDSPKPLKL